MKPLAAAIAATLATLAIVSTHDTPSITVIDSGDSSELVTTIPVTSGGAYQKRVVYSVPVGDLAPGDTLLVSSEMESTNNLGFNVMQCSTITVTDSPTATAGSDATETNCYNISPNMHHGVTPKVGSFAVTADMPDAHVNLVVYSAAYLATASSTLKIEPDYGRLVVTIIKG